MADDRPVGYRLAHSVKRWIIPLLSALALGAVFCALVLIASVTEDPTLFTMFDVPLFVLIVVGTVGLLSLIAIQVRQLGRLYPRGEPGWKLIKRMVGTFVGLASIPLILICVFATIFIRNSIHAWYAPPVNRVVHTAIQMSRDEINDTLKQDLHLTKHAARTIAMTPPAFLPFLLERLRHDSHALDLVLLREDGRILAVNSVFPFPLLPPTPSRAALSAAVRGETNVVLTSSRSGHYVVRAVVPIPLLDPLARPLILETIYPVSTHVLRTAKRVEQAYARYEELTLLRRPLTWSLVLILVLVALLGFLSLVTAALYFARQIVAPVDELVDAIGAVADGRLDVRLETGGGDFGPLKRSFNRMIGRLDEAQRIALAHRQLEERERTLLETVLAHLTAGVLVFDELHALELSNEAARRLLALDPIKDTKQSLPTLMDTHPNLKDFFSTLDDLLHDHQDEARREVILGAGPRRRILVLRVTTLPELPGIGCGHAVVFEDVTELIEAQHDAAWGEVARRMAHEIRNPLTPIQLTAERIGNRFLERLEGEDRVWLEHAVDMIVRQVEALQNMVRAFSEYARAPDLHFTRFDLNALVREVVELYRGRRPNLQITMNLQDPPPLIEADEERLRQVLHNLLRNALEALQDQPEGSVAITLHYDILHGDAELLVEDNGPGFSPAMLEHAFEPYATSKQRGTGLGLAITKKIVEEHGGHALLSNRLEGGARIAIVLPLNERMRSERLRAAARHYQHTGTEPL